MYNKQVGAPLRGHGQTQEGELVPGRRFRRSRDLSRLITCSALWCLAIFVGSLKADVGSDVLMAINRLEVAPFAYASSDASTPDERNVSVVMDSEGGSCTVIVRLRSNYPDSGKARCARDIFEAAFRGNFSYAYAPANSEGEPVSDGGGFWGGSTDTLLWNDLTTGFRPCFPVFPDVDVRAVKIEFYTVEDSVLSWERIGVSRVQQVQQVVQDLFFGNEVPRCFYWTLQSSYLHVPRARTTPLLRKMATHGPAYFQVWMALDSDSTEDWLSLASVRFPIVARDPKSVHMDERWTLNREDLTGAMRTRSYQDWDWAKVSAVLKVERFINDTTGTSKRTGIIPGT
jgi:hypothetical protein